MLDGLATARIENPISSTSFLHIFAVRLNITGSSRIDAMADRNATCTDEVFGRAVNAATAFDRRAYGSVAEGGEETRPEVIHQLEELDDVIFAAIDGDQAALQESPAAWHRAVRTLGADTIEETRRQYLRHAQSVWEDLRHQNVQPQHKILAAIEIIGLLVNSER
jgi:hypothetical protein